MKFNVIRYLANIIAKEVGDRTTRLSWILIIISSSVVIYIFSVIELGTSKQAIYPKLDNRKNISTLVGARLDEVCPEAARDPHRAAYEECLTGLDRSKLIEFEIPTFDEIGDIPPDMPSDLSVSKDPKQKKAAEIFAPNTAFLVGIPIPEGWIAIDGGYWETDDKGKRTLAMQNKVRSRPLLTFRGMRFGTVCIEGRCNQELLESTAGANTISLTWRVPPAPIDRIVWLFGMEAERPHGLLAYEGILVAKAQDLMSANRLYSIHYYGKQMRMAQNFAALFIVALVFGILHRGFLDYAALTAFAASGVFWQATLILGVLLPWYRGPFHHAGYFLSWGLLLTSSVMLTCGLRRDRKKLVCTMIWGSIFSIAGAVTIYFVALKMDVSKYWGLLSALFVIFISLANLYLFADQIPVLVRLKSSIGSFGRASLKKDYSNRQWETAIHLSIWAIVTVSMWKYAWGSISSSMVQRFSSSILLALFPILGVMLFFMYSKQRTHVRSNPHAEVLRLQQRLSPEEFANMMAKTRQNIVWTLDIEGSTGRNRVTKRLMMQKLLNQAARDLEDAQSFLELPTGGGDEWRLITGKSFEKIADDLRAKVHLLQSRYSSYLKIVQDDLPGCGLHAVVMVLSQYSMACGVSEGETALPTIDFSGEEADALMAHLGKPTLTGGILICGSRVILEQGLSGMQLMDEFNSLTSLLEDKIAKIESESNNGSFETAKKIVKLTRALDTSRQFDLVYVHIDAQTESAFSNIKKAG